MSIIFKHFNLWQYNIFNHCFLKLINSPNIKVTFFLEPNWLFFRWALPQYDKSVCVCMFLCFCLFGFATLKLRFSNYLLHVFLPYFSSKYYFCLSLSALLLFRKDIDRIYPPPPSQWASTYPLLSPEALPLTTPLVLPSLYTFLRT